jgi:hypothetical protein
MRAQGKHWNDQTEREEERRRRTWGWGVCQWKEGHVNGARCARTRPMRHIQRLSRLAFSQIGVRTHAQQRQRKPRPALDGEGRNDAHPDPGSHSTSPPPPTREHARPHLKCLDPGVHVRMRCAASVRRAPRARRVRTRRRGRVPDRPILTSTFLARGQVSASTSIARA